MSACSTDADRPRGCPTPRLDRAYEVLDTTTGELLLVPIPCGRNGCPYCRPRNVQVTAAKMGINAALSDTPPTVAVLSTTRNWADQQTLIGGWKELRRRARAHVHPDTKCAWFREWTTGRSDAIRRTHYHSIWSHLTPEQGEAVAELSRDVWAGLTGAYSRKAHGSKPIWDAGGLTRYVAGLAGHHLKSEQAPPPGWFGRRFGTSKGFYAIDSRELDRQAKAAVRDERLAHALTAAILADFDVDDLPEAIVDDELTRRLELARTLPKPRVVRVRPGWSS